MTTPLPFEKQDPEGAKFLGDLYSAGGSLLAYFWQRGFKNGVGRSPQTPNHTPIAFLPDGREIYFF